MYDRKILRIPIGEDEARNLNVGGCCLNSRNNIYIKGYGELNFMVGRSPYIW